MTDFQLFFYRIETALNRTKVELKFVTTVFDALGKPDS